MKRILFIAAILCFGFSTLAADLEMSVVPNNPLLIVSSSNAGKTGPVAPYFAVNSLKMTWKGSSEFQLLNITVLGTVAGSTEQKIFSCGGASSSVFGSFFEGTNIRDCKGNVFQPALSSNGNVIIPVASSACPLTVESAPFYCDKLPVEVSSNPMATYNIPAKVVVLGESLDSSGSAHRILEAQDIVIQ